MLEAILYPTFVSTLCKSGESVKQELTPSSAHLLHMAVGVSGEAGELLDCIKRHSIYGKELDVPNLIEELGDLMFYMQGIMNELNLSSHICQNANVDKLMKRYKEATYSNEAAITRADKQPSAV